MQAELNLSPLPHTWLLDLDGTLLAQNGFMQDGDKWLPGAVEFLRSIPRQDYVVILTARDESLREITEGFLNREKIRYDKILYGIPTGERILLNDIKESGLKCAYAVNLVRDCGPGNINFRIDPSL